MNKVIMFFAMLYREFKEDDLLSIANDLTFKMLLSLFPLIIFLLSVIGFLELDISYLMDQISNTLPEGLVMVINTFEDEVINVKSAGLLSTSLLFAIFSASSGFNSVIKCINKAYGYKDTRNIVAKRLLSVLLVLVFALTIIISMVMFIFSDFILAFIHKYFYTNGIFDYLFGLVGYVCSMAIILFAVMVINRLALSKRVTIGSLLPGALVTVVAWFIASKGFNIYINNFSRYSAIYGSVASIMILMIWFNIICVVLLFGSEVNAIIEKSHKKKSKKEKGLSTDS